MIGHPFAVARSASRLLVGALAVLALAGCARQIVRQDFNAALQQQIAREALLKDDAEWSLAARLAVSGGGEGGSGRLLWTQQNVERYRFDVQAPVTRQTWRLDVEPGSARLEGLEAGVREGTDPAELLAREVGWVLPLANLASWVRGSRAAGQATIEFAADGLPTQIVQQDWVIDYRDWFRDQSPPLPKKIFAQKGERKVRLVIERWQTAGEP